MAGPAGLLDRISWRCSGSTGYVRPHPKERLLPTGTVELVIDLREGTHGGAGAVVCGAYSEFFEIDTAAEIAAR